MGSQDAVEDGDSIPAGLDGWHKGKPDIFAAPRAHERAGQDDDAVIQEFGREDACVASGYPIRHPDPEVEGALACLNGEVLAGTEVEEEVASNGIPRTLRLDVHLVGPRAMAAFWMNSGVATPIRGRTFFIAAMTRASPAMSPERYAVMLLRLESVFTTMAWEKSGSVQACSNPAGGASNQSSLYASSEATRKPY